MRIAVAQHTVCAVPEEMKRRILDAECRDGASEEVVGEMERSGA
jgi:hypothetical protein